MFSKELVWYRAGYLTSGLIRKVCNLMSKPTGASDTRRKYEQHSVVHVHKSETAMGDDSEKAPGPQEAELTIQVVYILVSLFAVTVRLAAPRYMSY